MEKDIPVLCYGTLLNPENLAKTILPRDYERVWIKKHKYIFNLKPRKIHIYPDAAPPVDVAIINVRADQDVIIPAGLIHVNEDELAKLRLRMSAYYTKKVPVYDFITKEKVKDAILFVGKKKIYGEEVTTDFFRPIQSYLRRARIAAYAHGHDFGRAFDSGTYFADGAPMESFLKTLDNKHNRSGV